LGLPHPPAVFRLCTKRFAFSCARVIRSGYSMYDMHGSVIRCVSCDCMCAVVCACDVYDMLYDVIRYGCMCMVCWLAVLPHRAASCLVLCSAVCRVLVLVMCRDLVCAVCCVWSPVRCRYRVPIHYHCRYVYVCIRITIRYVERSVACIATRIALPTRRIRGYYDNIYVTN
jgi:hypothetical protein